MKYIFILFVFILASCAKQNPVHDSENQFLNASEMEISKNRTKELNSLERSQIEDWIKTQTKSYYPMGMNYWVDKEGLDKNARKNNGESVSYEFDIYDFDRVKLYEEAYGKKDVVLGRFDEIQAVEDALRYLKKGEEVELLIPSVLAYGTYGDNKKILTDMPLIIKLKLL